MGQTLENGVYLPSEGERNCYAGLKTNWEILDQKVADVTALQQAVAGALHRQIVASLPTTDIDPNTIYMVLSGTSATENVYNEFMYVNNAWELIGTSATDLTNYYTKVEVDGKLLLKANDSDVVHKSGDETVAGIKNFTDDTYVKSLNFTNEVPSQSSSSSSIMPLVTTVTYTDQTASKVARINLRITASGDKSLYPHENNQYALGLTSRKWSEIHGVTYYYGSSDVEFSTKFVTTDTDQDITGLKSFIGLRTEFKRSNGDGVALFSNGGFTKGSAPTSLVNICRKYYGDATSIGSALGYSSVSVDNNGNKTTYQFYCIDNTAGSTSRTTIQMNYDKSLSGTNAQYINISGSLLPSTDNSYSLGNSTNKWSTINGLNPSSLGMPDLSNGIDISSYITHLDKVVNNYTPPANGWLSIRVKKTSLVHASLMIYQTGGLLSSCETDEFNISGTNLPVIANKNVEIYIYADSLASAIFYPCQGNV